MKTPEFSSVFAASLRRFVAFRRVGGCAYANGARDLAIFDHFVSAQGQSQPLLSSALFAQYRTSMPQVNAKTRYTRLCVVRHFSAFHHLEYPQSEVLHELGVRTVDKVRFILLSESEVSELLQATPALRGRRWSPDTARCLIGLLYSCGLRISEALALRLSDFDPAQATLFVRRGKFGKQRCLPLSASTQAVLDRYLKDLRLPPRMDADTPLFADSCWRPLSYATVHNAFRYLLAYTGLRTRRGPVRLHDLRHSFASAVLRRTVQAGGDVHAMLPRLATYMGHVMIRSTQVYLHTDAAGLADVGRRFHHAFYTPVSHPQPRSMP